LPADLTDRGARWARTTLPSHREGNSYGRYPGIPAAALQFKIPAQFADFKIQ